MDTAPNDPKTTSARAEAATALADVCDTAARILDSFVPAIPQRTDVVWLDHIEDARSGSRAILRVAPLSVAGLLRNRLFGPSTAVLTSATLTIGGSFDAMASAWGLTGGRDRDGEPAQAGGAGRWRGLDVGSPFDHAKIGNPLRRRAPAAPGRDGTGSAEQLEEITALIEAADGRTLGLFSSMRAARATAEVMRERLETPVLCQGDDTTSALVQRFAEDEQTSLFGTLSLWQGVDVPGPSLSLVLIDRIPFPRPDDPLLTAGSARSPRAAATVSWPWPPATRHCCSPRAQAGCCAASTTAAWWPCSTPGWPPRATAATCARRCRRSGRRPTAQRCARRCSGCAPCNEPAGSAMPTGRDAQSLSWLKVRSPVVIHQRH